MSKLWDKLKALQKTTFEKQMQKRGYKPGAETDSFRLWYNDDDECYIEEKGKAIK